MTDAESQQAYNNLRWAVAMNALRDREQALRDSLAQWRRLKSEVLDCKRLDRAELLTIICEAEAMACDAHVVAEAEFNAALGEAREVIAMHRMDNAARGAGGWGTA